MANIALCSEFPSDTGVLDVETFLESVAGGLHTVTVINDDNVGTTDFSSYDLIITVIPDIDRRVANGATYRSEIDGGKPAVLHIVDGSQGNGTGVTTTVVEMDLCGTVTVDTSETSITVEDDTHEITDEFGTGSLIVFGASATGAGIEAGDHVGENLAVGQNQLLDLPVLVAIEAGTLDKLGVEIGARVVMYGFMRHHGGNVTADGEALLKACVDWALEEGDDPERSSTIISTGAFAGVG